MLNHLRSSVYTLTVPIILLSLFSNLLCKIAKDPTLLPVDLKNKQSCQQTNRCHMFISVVDTTMSSLLRDEKDGENRRIIVENKHINGLEII